jgi:hypothetical protein
MLATKKECSCGSDAYVTYWAEKGLNWCHKCKAPAGIAPIGEAVKKKLKVDRMPDKIEDLTARKWNKIRPWKNFTFDFADHFGFYLAELHGRVRLKNGGFDGYDGVYLVMPVIRDGVSVSFSARLLSGTEHAPKYVIPTDVQKTYWVDEIPCTDDLVFLCEGIADAAYLSWFGGSVGLLGVNYDGSLDDLLIDSNIVVALDGDCVGAAQGMKLAFNLSDRGFKRVRILPLEAGKDPTDYTYPELEKILKGIGVELDA